MIRDITIGQYYPVESPIHRLDPRVKLISTFFYIVSLFLFRSFVGYAVASLLLFTVIHMSKVPFSYIVRGLKAIVILLLFTSIFNVLFTPGTEIFQIWKIKVTIEGLRNGAFMTLRLIFLILGSSIMTFTTTPNQLTDGLEKIMAPLKKLRVPVHEFAMMMSLAIRFIPILLEEADKIMKAQSARGANFEEGKLLTRARSLVAILVPLLVSAIRRAEELGLAMESRCYTGGEGRTKMKPLRYKKIDFIAYCVLAIYFVSLIAVNRGF
jgi:energy-coupling factor transport system permease protein